MSNSLIGVVSNPYANLFRSGGTKRWTIVQMQRQQTLAEHHAIVASLVLQLCNELDMYQTNFRLILVEHALSHDLQEVVTGDLPTPGKAALGAAVGQAINNAEDVIRKDMGIHHILITDQQKNILRAADNLEALWFCGTHLQDGVGLEALGDIATRTASVARIWSPALRVGARRCLAAIIAMVINERAIVILKNLHEQLGEMI